LFRPQLVIMSDDERQFDSQDTDDWYRTRCSGAVFATNPSERRYIATTRKDGAMRIDVDLTGRWTIERVSVRDWPRRRAPTPSHAFGFGALSALRFDRNPLATDFVTLLSALSTPPVSPPHGLGLGALEFPNNISTAPLSRAFGLAPFAYPTPTKR
jgi:hypothetical protein